MEGKEVLDEVNRRKVLRLWLILSIPVWTEKAFCNTKILLPYWVTVWVTILTRQKLKVNKLYQKSLIDKYWGYVEFKLFSVDRNSIVQHQNNTAVAEWLCIFCNAKFLLQLMLAKPMKPSFLVSFLEWFENTFISVVKCKSAMHRKSIVFTIKLRKVKGI